MWPFSANLDVLYFLFFSIIGMLLSSVGLFLLGHRVKTSHWGFSLFYLYLTILLSKYILNSANFYSPGDSISHVIVVAIGVFIVAVTVHWNSPGQIAFIWIISGSISFLAYAGLVTFTSHLGPLSLIFSILLLILEIMALALLVAHSFEVIDVICRRKWKRIFVPEPTEDYFPLVSIHVPAHNEPPGMVIQTLNALANLEYPAYEVLVIDNNTTDESLWKPLEEHCLKLGFTFIHLENWPGFKSGALNYGLKKTSPDAEIIGIIDADYVVTPNYLKDLVGFFKDKNTAFVQTPQDYRDFDEKDTYAMACYHSYSYFFSISMATRNERNSIIFGGTMGLIRRRVLEEMGGWSEWCITEDAEISLRMLNAGYDSVYIDRSYGKGLMPLNFEGLKKQRFRWAFGGMQILRMHWDKLMPWSSFRDSANKLSIGQKLDYLTGGLQWLNDPIAFAFTVILLLSGITLVSQNTIYLQPLAGAAILVPFIFIFFGITKFLWAFRLRVRCSLLQAWRAFMVLLSMTWIVTLACFLGLTKKHGVFLRTLKQRGRNTFWRSLRIIEKEIFLAVICLMVMTMVGLHETATLTTFLLVGLLSWQTFIYGTTLPVTQWSWNSEMLAQNPALRYTSRTTGERFRSMISDRRATLALAGLTTLVVFLFYQAVTKAPEIEKIYRTNPEHSQMIAPSLIRTPPETHVAAKIFFEERAALRSDVGGAMALWSANGIIKDLNYTPNDTTDDRVWTGTAEIRQRYEDEFSIRKYIQLDHRNISTFIEEDRASVVNDLDASLMSDGKLQKVYLSKGDQWILRKEGNEWKIIALTINRTPR